MGSEFFYNPEKGAQVGSEVREAAYHHNLHAEPGRSNFTADPLLKQAEEAGLIEPGTIRTSRNQDTTPRKSCLPIAIIPLLPLVPLAAMGISRLIHSK